MLLPRRGREAAPTAKLHFGVSLRHFSVADPDPAPVGQGSPRSPSSMVSFKATGAHFLSPAAGSEDIAQLSSPQASDLPFS